MNARTNAEKEWLRKMTTGQTAEKEEVKAPKRTAEAQTPTKEVGKRSCRGFQDVAGMDELKQLVTEGFINVHKGKDKYM